MKYPIGIQNFEKLRSEGYLYVDKTAHIMRLTQEGCYYFLSRPRRFGKSLLLSTIQAYYEGKRELFRGLAIDTDEVSWTEHPVMHLDLNAQKYDAPDSVDAILKDFLKREECKYDTVSECDSLGLRFCNLIRNVYAKTGKRVVILIDEYDKPLLQTIGNPCLQDAYRETLRSFYAALKTMDGSIQFAFLTGVTKFGKVNIFSDLNQLNDISMDARYYDICGISEEEIGKYFSVGVGDVAAKNKISQDECRALLKERYDGYHFHPASPGIYNPYSLLYTLHKKEFGSYWFETGTPTYLVTLLQSHDYNLEELSEVETDADVLNSTDGGNNDPIPVIYQSGYLTIKGYDREFGLYKLGFPNKEVEEGFFKFLIPYYTCIPKSDSSFEVTQFVKDVRTGQTEQFISRLRSFFADTPYEMVKDLENHYQNVLFIISRLMGLYTQVEYHTSEGRVDMVIQTANFCYIIEFKFNGSAEEALDQIKQRHYTLPFELSGKIIICIGMNFSSKTRNIEDAKILHIENHR